VTPARRALLAATLLASLLSSPGPFAAAAPAASPNAAVLRDIAIAEDAATGRAGRSPRRSSTPIPPCARAQRWPWAGCRTR